MAARVAALLSMETPEPAAQTLINYPGHGYTRRFGWHSAAFSTTRPPENAEIENRNGNVARALAGYTQFEHNATASNAMLTAFGSHRTRTRCPAR